MGDITQITKNTYLSDWNASLNVEDLENKNIRAVLCLNKREKPAYIIDDYLEVGIRHKHIHLDDHPNENIIEHFAEIDAFITENIANPVLIHCTAGISRSATALASYLLKNSIRSHPDVSVDIVLRFIDSHRPIRPNPGFYHQLKKYEMQLRGF